MLKDLTGIIKENDVHGQMGLDVLPAQLATDIGAYAHTAQSFIKATIATYLFQMHYQDISQPPGGVGGGIPAIIEKFHNHLYVN